MKCGKKAEIENFCEKCFLEGNKLFDIDNFTLNFCKACNNFFLKTKKISLDDAIKSKIKTKNKIKKIEIKRREVGNKIYVTVSCSGYIKPCKKIKNEEKEIVINIEKKLCDICTKLSGGYYEAVIQIRGENSEKIFKKIKWMLRNIVVCSIEKQKYGYDIRFVSKKDAFNISNQLRKKFSVKTSSKLVGEKKGEKLYRNVYVIR